MIVLDTNVVSELMKGEPDAALVELAEAATPPFRLDQHGHCLLKIRLGISLCSTGRRRAQLEQSSMRMLSEKIENRILPFDTAAAEQAATLAAARQRSGRLGELRDTMIAGIAIAHRATLATRHIRHFSDLPIPAVNPWAA